MQFLAPLLALELIVRLIAVSVCVVPDIFKIATSKVFLCFPRNLTHDLLISNKSSASAEVADRNVTWYVL